MISDRRRPRSGIPMPILAGLAVIAVGEVAIVVTHRHSWSVMLGLFIAFLGLATFLWGHNLSRGKARGTKGSAGQ